MNSYSFFNLSADALGWTKHWLGEKRCDLLGIAIANDEAVNPKVRVIAVESKARTEKQPIPLNQVGEPFAGAIEQVVTTLDALSEILCPDVPLEHTTDIKQGVFIEHLVSEVLAQIYPISNGDKYKAHILKILTGLSRREFACDSQLVFEGLVVVTQTAATVPTIRKKYDAPGKNRLWSLTLVRCGIPELRGLFERSGLGAISDVLSGNKPSQSESSPSQPHHEPKTPQAEFQRRREDSGAREEEPEMAERQSTYQIGKDVSELIDQLQTACRLRKFHIEDIDVAKAQEGPTLVNVPVVLEPGESIAPIENALKDIARELGIPSLGVENDPRPYHIRFLLPRKERLFPDLPKNKASTIDAADKQYLGFELGISVDTMPYRSHVSEWPHLLVAGTTGSGKTTLLKSILKQLGELPKGSLEVVVVDGKAEYDYVGIVPKDRYSPVFDDVLLGHEHATGVLRWLIDEEIGRRREVLRQYFLSNPAVPRQPKDAYIQALSSGKEFPIRPILIVVDEFAEIMQASGKAAKEFSELIQRAVQTGRSTLVHLLLATQRPGTAVISGEIKANLPTRIALKLPSHHDSMTIIDRAGAEDLLGRGDMLVVPSSGGIFRLQGYSVEVV